jgi:SAM-dependent methyltransferase
MPGDKANDGEHMPVRPAARRRPHRTVGMSDVCKTSRCGALPCSSNSALRAGVAVTTTAPGRDPSGRVLDLGCGAGPLSQRIGQKGFSIWGLGLSPALIALARERLPQAEFHCGSVLDADLPQAVAVAAVGEVLDYATAQDSGGVKHVSSACLMHWNLGACPSSTWQGLDAWALEGASRRRRPGSSAWWRRKATTSSFERSPRFETSASVLGAAHSKNIDCNCGLWRRDRAVDLLRFPRGSASRLRGRHDAAISPRLSRGEAGLICNIRNPSIVPIQSRPEADVRCDVRSGPTRSQA